MAGAPPTYYVEWHTGLSQVFQANLISLVCHGVFERFPTLKVVITEGGLGWIPDVLWRLDKNVKGLRDEVPVGQAAAERVRRSTTSGSPASRSRSRGVASTCTCCATSCSAERTLMFSSDYPHWDFDYPRHALTALPAEHPATGPGRQRGRDLRPAVVRPWRGSGGALGRR